jgi:hypothetical protein
MKRAMPIIAGAAVLALANVALAEEPITLTDAQLDTVTAAGAFVSADLTGDAIVNGNFFLDNLPGVFSVAAISASIQPISGIVQVDLVAVADTFD